jgi:RNA polymerase sigma-70 factor (ECF subfamily)
MVAINVCRDHQRHERRAPQAAPVPIDVAEPLAELPDASLDPLERLEQQERHRLVREALESLSPPHRTVIYMRDHEDMSYEQIADALAVPVGTVRSRLHNARAALAHALEQTMRGLPT